jgi:hypothetical protein
MPLENDIIERIQKDFRPDESACAIELLSECGETGYIARCIVVAAQGSLESLRANIRQAKSDFRDVVMAAEYDGTLKLTKARDLCFSFLVDAPEKFWISEVGPALQLRGYTLSSLETSHATVGPVCLRYRHWRRHRNVRWGPRADQDRKEKQAMDTPRRCQRTRNLRPTLPFQRCKKVRGCRFMLYPRKAEAEQVPQAADIRR